MRFSKTKKINEDVEEQEGKEESKQSPINIIVPKDEDMRLIGLFGEVEEQKASILVGALFDLMDTAEVEQDIDPENPDLGKEVVSLPIDFVISTPGGSADDMFALYDMMRVVREKCDIVTFGLGKVMSAGVLLLASGTKGKRKIGKNCRVMIHSVVGGNAGSFHNLENEMEEIKYIQTAYLKALADETKMTYNELRKMIDKKVNVYLSAEEAVKLGIADIII